MSIPFKYNNVIVLLCLILLAIVSSCTGEDRSDEMPLAPKDVTISMQMLNDTSVILKGRVGDSHNNPLTKCGFIWGNSKESHQETASTGFDFADTVIIVTPGNYYAIAFATNYIGTTNSDTLRFAFKAK